MNNYLLATSIALLAINYGVLFLSWKSHSAVSAPILLALNVGVLYLMAKEQQKQHPTLKNIAGNIVSTLGILSIAVILSIIAGGILGYYYHDAEGILIPIIGSSILLFSLMIISKVEK